MMLPKPPARWLLAALLLWTCGTLVEAHPGHALHEAPATHVATSPDHLALLVLGGVLLFGLVVGRFLRHRGRDDRVS